MFRACISMANSQTHATSIMWQQPAQAGSRGVVPPAASDLPAADSRAAADLLVTTSTAKSGSHQPEEASDSSAAHQLDRADISQRPLLKPLEEAKSSAAPVNVDADQVAPQLPSPALLWRAPSPDSGR